MLYELFDAALRSAGVSARRRDRFTDRGDGLLALIDPADQALLFNLVIPVFSQLLAGYNASLPDPGGRDRQLRVRVVMHTGNVHDDDNGCFGEALDIAFRLLDAPRVKTALKAAQARPARCLRRRPQPGHIVLLRRNRPQSLPAGPRSDRRPRVPGLDPHSRRSRLAAHSRGVPSLTRPAAGGRRKIPAVIWRLPLSDSVLSVWRRTGRYVRRHNFHRHWAACNLAWAALLALPLLFNYFSLTFAQLDVTLGKGAGSRSGAPHEEWACRAVVRAHDRGWAFRSPGGAVGNELNVLSLKHVHAGGFFVARRGYRAGLGRR